MFSDYATWHGEMDQVIQRPKEGKPVTVRMTLQSAARRRGKSAASAQAQLTPPYLPTELRYVWELFTEFLEGVAGNGMTSLRVTWRDLRAWATQMQHALAPWESRLILVMSESYISAVAPKEAV